MAYELLKEREANGEILWLKDTYGQAFADAFDQWTKKLCEQAEERVEFESADDVVRILDDLLNEKMPSDLRRSWQKAKAAGWVDKAKAILATIRNRRPPWRARVLERHGLPGLDSRITLAVRVYLSIDDVKKNVVIRAVDQLES